MAKTFLNITNGDVLTKRLKELHYEGDFLTWREMLCEGPTSEFIGSETYFKQRQKFFSDYYDLIFEPKKFEADLAKLNKTEFSHIVLWFEYDLFCHINMIAVISLILQRNINIPVYLVCSGYTKKEHTLLGLSELSDKQLKLHYDSKILLSTDDLQWAYSLWKIYCGKDHNLFKHHITEQSAFKYMSNALKAHLKRFPDSKSGLGAIEKNILEIITKNKIKSKHHLLGYILNYQGFYGYGDTQLERVINNLDALFTEKDGFLELNNFGEKAFNSEHNVTAVIYNNMTFGGINRMDYQFSIEENKLITPNFNASQSF